jgi:hypothetical protein
MLELFGSLSSLITSCGVIVHRIGSLVFQMRCASCHVLTFQGLEANSLAAPTHGHMTVLAKGTMSGNTTLMANTKFPEETAGTASFTPWERAYLL